MSKGSSRILTPTGSPLLSRQSLAGTPPSPKDFEMPCGKFKSSFARSLSMNNAGNYQNKTIDYNVRQQQQQQQQQQQFNDNNNNINQNNQEESFEKDQQNFINEDCPPLPERLNRSLKRSSSKQQQQQQQQITNQNSNCNSNLILNGNVNSNGNLNPIPIPSPSNGVICNENGHDEISPPAIPARRSLPVNNVEIKNNKNISNNCIVAKVSYNQQQQQHQQQQQYQSQYFLKQFKENSNGNNNNTIVHINNDMNNLISSHGNFNKISYHMQQYHQHHPPQKQHHLQLQNQQQQSNHLQQQHQINLNTNTSNFNKNVVVVWPKNNEEQDFNYNHVDGNHNDGNNDAQDHDVGEGNDREAEHASNKSTAMTPDITAMAVPAPQSALLTTPLSTQIINDQQQQIQLHHHQQQQQQQHYNQQHFQTPLQQQQYFNQHHQQQQYQQHQHQLQHQKPHQQQRPLSFESHHNDAGNSAPINLEALLLQKEMDSLQWQLKQVETNCDMYRAVLQEVARFLERYNSHKTQMQQATRTNMERSKSLYHVYSYNDKENNNKLSAEVQSPTANYLRARSSTNLIDLKAPTKNSNNKVLDSTDKIKSNDGMSPYTYEGYKDFTWRRSPRKYTENVKNPAQDKMEEKLNKEAFRLSRTIQNVLNTSIQQAELTHRNWLSRMSRTPSGSTMTLNTPPIHNSTSLTLVENNTSDSSSHDSSVSSTTNTSPDMLKSSEHLASTNNVDIIFLRANNIRESRLSLRSSTDSSVHSSTSFSATSTTSSKAETDEDLQQHGGYMTHSVRSAVGAGGNGTLTPNGSTNPSSSALHLMSYNNLISRPSLGGGGAGNGFSTEDESGFSSINSFQDIGVPLSSTLLSNAQTNDNPRLSLTLAPEKKPVSLKTTLGAAPASTLPAPAPAPNSMPHPNNVLGVPLSNTNTLQQANRWDSNIGKTKNPQKTQRLSMPCSDDSATVHWV